MLAYMFLKDKITDIVFFQWIYCFTYPNIVDTFPLVLFALGLDKHLLASMDSFLLLISNTVFVSFNICQLHFFFILVHCLIHYKVKMCTIYYDNQKKCIKYGLCCDNFYLVFVIVILIYKICTCTKYGLCCLNHYFIVNNYCHFNMLKIKKIYCFVDAFCTAKRRLYYRENVTQDENIETGPTEKFNYAELKSVKAKLDLLYDKKIKGTQIR